MTAERPPRRFYAVAVGAGFAFASMAIAVPLHVVAVGAKAAVAGDLLAVSTIAIALGALAAGRIGTGGPRTLTVALAVIGVGSLTLVAANGIALLGLGAAIVGGGIGMFWVASQLILSRRAGEPEGARAFLFHYAAYTFGTVSGSSLTGGLASAAKALGFSTVTGIRASSVVAVAAAIVAFVVWRGCAAFVAGAPAPAVEPVQQSRQLAVQVPDLLLVAALALLLPLAPVVLAREFGLAPFSIGLVMGGVALSKIAGTFVARLITSASGPRRTILILLAAGASFCLLLCSAITLSLFVTTLFAVALTGTGVWPLVVDAGQARVEPGARRSLTVRWNAREYILIAVATALSGWLLTTVGSAVPIFALAALLFACSAGSAAILLRRPVWRYGAAT
jgi:MFS family permease